jgi:hypothetical protein
VNGLFCRILNEINGNEIGTIPLHVFLQKIDTLLKDQGSGYGKNTDSATA